MYIYGMQLISCIEIAKNTQTLKIADFTMWSGLQTLKITVFSAHGIAIYSIFSIGMTYIGRYRVKEHVQSFQNMYGKGG